MQPMVELRHVRVFLAAAEELHFGRAGERTGLSTSRVSQTISLLEARAGGRLFDRTSRRVTLTPLGKQLLATAGPAYRQLEQAFEQTRAAAKSVAGLVRLGMYSPVAGGPHMLEIVNTFEERYPACKVTFTDIGWTRVEEEWLRSARVDLLAVRLPRTVPDITIGPILSREARILLVSENDPIAQRRSVRLDDFSDRTLPDVPTMSREMVSAFIPPRAPNGTEFKTIVVRSTLETLMLVAEGRIVHPTVQSFVDFHPHPATVGVPIEDLPPSETALAWLTGNRSPNVHAFVRTAIEVLGRRLDPADDEQTPQTRA